MGLNAGERIDILAPLAGFTWWLQVPLFVIHLIADACV
jgi:hypothetical protein